MENNLRICDLWKAGDSLIMVDDITGESTSEIPTLVIQQMFNIEKEEEEEVTVLRLPDVARLKKSLDRFVEIYYGQNT